MYHEKCPHSVRSFHPIKKAIMTFSIVAYSSAEQSWGVAVASKFLAAPAVVSWAKAGAGAVATQALGRVSFGPRGLELMAEGISAVDALAQLLASDEGRAHRQVGLVDVNGSLAAHTGTACIDYAGHIVGDN